MTLEMPPILGLVTHGIRELGIAVKRWYYMLS